MKFLHFAILLCLTAVMPTTASAYVGPGAGLGGILVAVALVLGVFLLIAGFLWYPLKRMLRGKKSATTETTED